MLFFILLQRFTKTGLIKLNHPFDWPSLGSLTGPDPPAVISVRLFRSVCDEASCVFCIINSLCDCSGADRGAEILTHQMSDCSAHVSPSLLWHLSPGGSG